MSTESATDSSGEDARGEMATLAGVLMLGLALVLLVVLLGLTMTGRGRRGLSWLLGEDDDRCGAAGGGQVRELKPEEDVVEAEW